MKSITVGIISSIILGLSLASQAAEIQERHAIGAGIGIHYGLAGASFDLPIADNNVVTFAFGQLYDEIGYNIGYRYYFREQNVTWRPRATIQYGTNGVISYNCFIFCDDSKNFQGVSASLGQTFAFGASKKHGFDLDVVFKLTDGGLDDEKRNIENQGYIPDSDFSGTSLSIGYHYSF